MDAFGKEPALAQDWGFAALVEYEGKRILFDTGNDAGKFARNVKRLGVDLTQLDFVVISHRHGDHTDGLHHLLKVNPNVKLYVPTDEYFGGPTPQVFFRQPEPTLPAHMRYFGGKVPNQLLCRYLSLERRHRPETKAAKHCQHLVGRGYRKQ